MMDKMVSKMIDNMPDKKMNKMINKILDKITDKKNATRNRPVRNITNRNKTIKKPLGVLLSAILAISLCACGSPGSSGSGQASGDSDKSGKGVSTNLEKIDSKAWKYNEDDDVYYQLGLSYCEKPADESYESLAVFVPGSYFKGEDNGDGTFTCKINNDGTAGDYTAANAPILMPINTPGYSAQDPLTEYSSFSEYTSEGMVYVHAGCRGRDAGAPAGVTDLKAAVRYIRYTDDVLPGDAESIFTFGMSGGGAQSSLMGATGDSSLYDPYLEEIGAVSGVSDSVLGSMCWCPITNLDSADQAYEWMMGPTRSGLSEEEQTISDELAASFAEYINAAGIKDPDGNTLTLDESKKGIYQAGSYYDYMKTVIETSLNHFLADTEFPYDASAESKQGGGMPGGGRPGGNRKKSFEEMDNISRNQTTSGLSLSGTYQTAGDYIDALNQNEKWVKYDKKTGTATITSIEAFVKAFKTASKNLGAFDQLDRGQGENTLFGYGDGNGAHFDADLAQILTDISSSYAQDYMSDLEKEDDQENKVNVRLNMYTPLYYLLESKKGYQTSSVAPYWRIRTGIAQGDCALSTEMNLALALLQYEGVESVDFETIWGAGHTMAERTGNSTDNFISWVNECMSAE